MAAFDAWRGIVPGCMSNPLRSLARRALARAGFRLQRIANDRDSSAGSMFPSRFTTADISLAISRVRHQRPGAGVWLLHDGYVAVPGEADRVLDCRTADPSLVASAGKDDVFVYACDSDEIGLPWVRATVAAARPFFPVESYRPATYAHVNDVARRTLEAEFVRQHEEGFAKWDFGPGDFLNIVQAIDSTAAVEGAYVEVGCYRGSSSAVAVRYMKEKGLARSCWFLDTFDGFSYEAAASSSDAIWAGTHATEGQSVVRERIARYADPSAGLTVRVERLNIVEEALPPAVGPIALANVDVDLYEAVKAALTQIAPRIAPGGILIVEDPGHTPALIGSRLALSDFLESAAAAAFTPVYLESGQTFLIRR